MTISIDAPKHLVTGARTGFLQSYRERGENAAYLAFTQTLNMGQKTVDMVDLGAAPMPVEQTGKGVSSSWVEKWLQVTPKDWEVKIPIEQNLIDDDVTGTIESRFRSAGAAFAKHLNKLAFQALNGGDGTTYGLCYDGQEFFDSDHADDGADYQTDQDNEYDLALTLDNFETVLVAAEDFLDDRGNPVDYNFDTIITSNHLRRKAYNICGNPQAYDTADRELNPYASAFKEPIISTYMDDTAWILVATSEEVKPLILGMRKQPELSVWKDYDAAGGGIWYFKWHARYNIFYGDWRLAIMGDS